MHNEKTLFIVTVSQEVDFSTFPLPPKGSRFLVDSTTYAFQENFILLSRYPEEESRLTAVTRPFSFIVLIYLNAKLNTVLY